MPEPDRTDLDAAAERIARRLAEADERPRRHRSGPASLTDRLLDVAMARPGFKADLFRFVDAFPAMTDDADVLAHVEQYLTGDGSPRLLGAGIGVAGAVPFGSALTAGIARRAIAHMARHFIIGTRPADAAVVLGELWHEGSAHTVDLLGEKTVTDADADRYATRVIELIGNLADAAAAWAPAPRLEADDLGPLARVNVSIKPTALAAHYEPLSRAVGLAGAKARIRPILRLARARGVHVHIDMEHADVKDLTLELARDLLGEDEFADVQAGVVVQAYLRDSHDDLADVIAWSARRSVPVTVRLVKGAYWDTEVVQAAAQGWPSPVYERKVESDANFERCTRLLLDHHGEVRAAFGSHNLRSLGHAVAYARSRGIADDGYELQMLHGMAAPLHDAVRRSGLRHRVYAPVGELVPGMAYLVRRLLENTSNESFVRAREAEGRALDELLRPPRVDALPVLAPVGPRPTTAAGAPAGYRPEPVREWRRAAPRAAMGAAVTRAASAAVLDVAALVAGERLRTAATIESVDPGEFDRVVARSASCGVAEADAAVAAGAAAFPAWAARPVAVRADVLFRAAGVLRGRREELAALEVFEAGKPWAEADADVCEAIDFCEYYGREALRLEAGATDRVRSPPGEQNRLCYRGKGVAVVIAPWNFPLAIPTGMVAAALVMGNPVVLKPAEQTPATAWALVEALRQAGAPDGVIQFLPGEGGVVGARLVEHAATALIAFTGSREVGLAIIEAAGVHRPGQRHVKAVIAEMGGKNPMIIDADADPDQAVPALVRSAFGYAGQKCSAVSRAIVVGSAWDAVVGRLAAGADEAVVGHPSDPATLVGPLIDAEAHTRLGDAAERAAGEGRILTGRRDLPDGGWYLAPTVVVDVDPAISTVWRDELFGPLLCVVRADDFDHAVALANDTPYALTAGCFSRSPAHLAQAAAELRAGNVYLNRSTTGAVVGRQPFGGYGLSGTGTKAGGPDYLVRFADARVTTENTVRQGFVPEP